MLENDNAISYFKSFNIARSNVCRAQSLSQLNEEFTIYIYSLTIFFERSEHHVT